MDELLAGLLIYISKEFLVNPRKSSLWIFRRIHWKYFKKILLPKLSANYTSYSGCSRIRSRMQSGHWGGDFCTFATSSLVLRKLEKWRFLHIFLEIPPKFHKMLCQNFLNEFDHLDEVIVLEPLPRNIHFRDFL